MAIKKKGCSTQYMDNNHNKCHHIHLYCIINSKNIYIYICLTHIYLVLAYHYLHLNFSYELVFWKLRSWNSWKQNYWQELQHLCILIFPVSINIYTTNEALWKNQYSYSNYAPLIEKSIINREDDRVARNVYFI